ncbi:ribosomal RNA processing protein 1 homolog B [Parambassis ranga]|uniref:Ribosomal RNA processing protein 1 homolog B n=1 Tax=Parambassis ranga TaxID=210632 RepID=A0A6P7H4D9_9TELE|nr:ribosomal RNA processing protein 1 homolog B [Parambassis ranga]
MATTENPEIHFAQRLASNDKTIRNRAIKKLRKYITIRSQKTAGGFTTDELLKLWKGLFYCLWMQDKPLLQEDLSNQISTLIHSFYEFNEQLLYLESFIQTLKREWTGIDRLRMDKFFQLVRFMFTQMFEALKKKNWESSAVSKFLELLTTKLLQNGSGAPTGLQFHILDLYMTELAAVGSSELTAEQNLMFIEPFCKTAAKTKDRTLFSAICSSIFTTIIDQAPFAIEDLMKELKACEDTGHVTSEEGNQDSGKGKPVIKKAAKQINGKTSDTDDDDDDDADADDMLNLEDSNVELSGDDDIGPVLQFDYAGLADKLFEFASRSCTPGHNRQRLYKIVKVLRDLNEGIFPQDEYPEEVSTDEDDEMFGSRKKKKRSQDNVERAQTAKMSKGKQVQTLKQDKGGDPADMKNNDEKKKKRKTEDPVQGQSVKFLEAKTQGPNSTVIITVATAPETLPLSEVKGQPSVTVTHEPNQKKRSHIHETPDTDATDADVSSGEHLISGKRRKKQSVKAVLETGRTEAVSCSPGEEPITPLLETGATSSLKKKKKSLKAKRRLEKEQKLNRVSAETPVTAAHSESAEDISTARCKTLTEAEILTKKNKKKNPKADKAPRAAAGTLNVEQTDTVTPLNKTNNQKKLKMAAKEAEVNKAVDEAQSQVEGGKNTEVPSGRKKVKKEKRKIPVFFEFETEEVEKGPSVNGFAEEELSPKKTKLASDFAELSTPLSTKKAQKKTKTIRESASDLITFNNKAVVPTPFYCKTKGNTFKTKSKTPTSLSKKVTFGLKNNKTAEFRKTDRSLLVSPDGSSRVPFDPEQKPKFGVLKSPYTKLYAISKKNPNSKTTTSDATKGTLKQRLVASDFF